MHLHFTILLGSCNAFCSLWLGVFSLPHPILETFASWHRDFGSSWKCLAWRPAPSILIWGVCLGGNKRSVEGLEALLELKDIFFAHFMLLDERAPHFPFLVFQGFLYIFRFFSSSWVWCWMFCVYLGHAPLVSSKYFLFIWK